jgi:hypothetical protein
MMAHTPGQNNHSTLDVENPERSKVRVFPYELFLDYQTLLYSLPERCQRGCSQLQWLKIG